MTVNASAGRQIDLTGGESVYCINTFQIAKARELHAGEGESSDRIRETMARMKTDLSRNERAAIAMLLLDELNSSPVA